MQNMKKSIYTRSRKRSELFLLRKILLPLIFKIYAHKDVDNKLVLFANYRFETMPDNMEPIYDALLTKDYKLIKLFASRKSNNKIIHKIANIRYFCRFTRYYAQAKYVVIDDYLPPLYANSARPETKVIQLWHGCGALKKCGYSSINTEWGMNSRLMKKYPIHTNYTHVCVSSPRIIPHYAESFNTPADKIYAYGTPRTDVLFDQAFIAKAKEKLQSLSKAVNGKKVILYAPTYREKDTTIEYQTPLINIKKIKEKINKPYILIYKAHPFETNSILDVKCSEDFVIDVKNKMNINELLAAADILISDYSSVIFEYSLLCRPMIFFAYDKDQYSKRRGFYYNYDTFIPGPMVKNDSELLEAINTVDEWFNPNIIRQFKEEFMAACDGHSTQRIIDNIF